MVSDISNMLFSTESVDCVVEGIKSREIVPQTILGGSTIAMLMFTHFPPNLLHLAVASLSVDIETLLAIQFFISLSYIYETTVFNWQKLILLEKKCMQFLTDFAAETADFESCGWG